MTEFNVDELKKEYGKYKEKYGMPEFAKVNGYFEIEKIDRKSDCFLRVIRKVIMEKVVSSLTFLETLVNPVNAPNIYLNYIKSITEKENKMINNVYGVLGELSIDSLNLEIDYDEKKEAELIKKAVNDWEKVKEDFSKILGGMKHPKNSIARERSYFG